MYFVVFHSFIYLSICLLKIVIIKLKHVVHVFPYLENKTHIEIFSFVQENCFIPIEFWGSFLLIFHVISYWISPFFLLFFFSVSSEFLGNFYWFASYWKLSDRITHVRRLHQASFSVPWTLCICWEHTTQKIRSPPKAVSEKHDSLRAEENSSNENAQLSFQF